MKQTILAMGFLLGSCFAANAQIAIGALNDGCEPIDIVIDAYYYDGNSCSSVMGAASGTVPAHTSPVPMVFYVPSVDPMNPSAVFNTYAVTFTVCDGAQGSYLVADTNPFVCGPYCLNPTGNYGFQIGCTVDPECGNPPGRSFDLELGGFPHPDYIIHYH